MFGRDKEKNSTSQQASQTKPTAQNPASSVSSLAPPTPPPASVPQSPKIETVIGANCHINGTLKSDGGIRIEGVFEGTLETTGNLVISETATVIAEVRAYNMSVSGSLKGNVTANKVEITETGKVWGDLAINSLLLHEGAYLKGQTNMGGGIEPPMIEAPRIVNGSPQLVMGEIVNTNNNNG
jgi:cytoskeletal protein CcmA (bactofilin family)